MFSERCEHKWLARGKKARPHLTPHPKTEFRIDSTLTRESTNCRKKTQKQSAQRWTRSLERGETPKGITMCGAEAPRPRTDATQNSRGWHGASAQHSTQEIITHKANRTRAKVTNKQLEAPEICLTSWEPAKGKLRRE